MFLFKEFFLLKLGFFIIFPYPGGILISVLAYLSEWQIEG